MGIFTLIGIVVVLGIICYFVFGEGEFIADEPVYEDEVIYVAEPDEVIYIVEEECDHRR